MGKVVNRAMVTTTSVGAGVIALGPAVQGQRTFNAAGINDGDQVSYVIEASNGAWEIGVGVYTHAGTTLSRVPTESSSGGAAIVLPAGTHRVFSALRAQDFNTPLFRGQVIIDAAADQKLVLQGSTAPFIDFRSVGGSTRYGTFTVAVNYGLLDTPGTMVFQIAGVTKFQVAAFALTASAPIQSEVAAGAVNLETTQSTGIIADNGVFNFPAVNYTLFFISEHTSTGKMALCATDGVNVRIIWQDAALFSAVADTAGKVNLYYNAGAPRIQNKSGVNTSFRIIVFKTQ